MEKALVLIEKYVQWVALGIGVLFLAYLGYSYWGRAPVSVKVGSKELLPGEIDAQVASTEVAKLKEKINDPTTLPSANLNIVATIKRDIFKQPEGPVGPIVVNDPTTKEVVPTFVDVHTPKLPGATFVDMILGRSIVAWPDATWVPDPRRPAATVPIIYQDKDWWSGAFSIDLTVIDKAFRDAKVPDQVYSTQLLRVWLIRQEKQDNGEWGPETTVGPLPNQVLWPFPEKNMGLQYSYDYAAWAQQNLMMLVKPSFVDTVAGKGTPWVEPGTPAAAAAAAAAAANPGGLVRPAAGEAPPPAPAVLPGGIRPGNRLGAAPGTPEAPLVTHPNPAAAETLPGAGAPDGSFNPAELSLTLPKFNVLAHDIELKPTRTYRYKVRYAVRNPLWQFKAAPPDVGEKFAAVSADSEWSKEVVVPSRVRFWIAGIKSNPSRGVGEVQFDVFVWEQGTVSHKTITAAVGDVVGDTRWTVVDVRGTQQRLYAILADPNAQAVRRDPRTDGTDPEYQALKTETGGSAAAPAASPAVAP